MLKKKKNLSFWGEIIQHVLGRRELLLTESMILVPPPSMMPVAQIDVIAQHEQGQEEIDPEELETLQINGSTKEEIHRWALLRNRYQHGGSDRVSVIRHLEFLKLLVQTGKIEQ